MFIRGLRTKIAFNLAVLFLVAMLLINIVAMMTAKRDIIRKEVSRGHFMVSTLSADLLDILNLSTQSVPQVSRAQVFGLLAEGGVSGAMVVGKNKERVAYGQISTALQNELLKHARSTMQSQERATHFFGTSWGVFWKHHRDLIISSPLQQNGHIVAGVSIVLPLEGIYTTLRRSQKMLFVYLFLNTIILTFIGIYRLSKVYFLPLARLASRAEDYHEDDDMLFSVRKEDNELHKLSASLNSMLRRISADKEKLRSTVNSLELANLELKKAQEEIIRAEKLASVGRLSAGIAHEIGNPIGIVMGYLDLLKQKDTPDSEKAEYIQRTEDEIERINTIIRQLLEISRPSKAGLKVVAVHDLIDDIAQVLNVQPLMSNIELECILEAQNDTVLADANQLRQVFLNLIINAADAISSAGNAANGKLVIKSGLVAEKQDPSGKLKQFLKITFMDNGPGISEENIGNIFDPFYTTKEPGKGTGLGLSVSFMIVQGFGGEMTVHSEKGEGTSLTILLPVIEGEATMNRNQDLSLTPSLLSTGIDGQPLEP
ncbi:MAG: ATP-binding protein [Desulfobacterales bacterium]